MEMQRCITAPSSIASTSRDISETNDDSSTIRPRNRVPNSSSKISIETTDNAQDLMKGFGFTFDPDLKASRVYMRVWSRDSNNSCSSSIVPSMGWSFLSGLSLADISNISTLSLPISCNELWNAQHYSLDTTLSLPISCNKLRNAQRYSLNTTLPMPRSSTESHHTLYRIINPDSGSVRKIPVRKITVTTLPTNSKILHSMNPALGHIEDDKLKNQEIRGEDSEGEDSESEPKTSTDYAYSLEEWLRSKTSQKLRLLKLPKNFPLA